MRERKYKQCILCEGRTLADSVELFNQEMKRLAKYHPTYERYDDKFLIYYTCCEQEPESLSERMEMKGCDHRCIECQHCERSTNRFGDYDGRMKKAMCNKKGHKVRLDSRVCDIFYEEYQDNRPFELITKASPEEKLSDINRRGA